MTEALKTKIAPLERKAVSLNTKEVVKGLSNSPNYFGDECKSGEDIGKKLRSSRTSLFDSDILVV